MKWVKSVKLENNLGLQCFVLIFHVNLNPFRQFFLYNMKKSGKVFEFASSRKSL